MTTALHILHALEPLVIGFGIGWLLASISRRYWRWP